MIVELLLRFILERAGVTEIECFARMNVHMIFEVSLVLEHFLAVRTFQSLSRVFPDVG